MSAGWRHLAVVVALLSAATPASAAPTASASAATGGSPHPAASVAPAEEAFGHARQFHLRADLSTGYHMLFRYDGSPRCNRFDPSKSEQQKFCGAGAPIALGLSAGYAPFAGFEPFAFTRWGLANEAENSNLGKLVQLGVGVRIYTMSDSRFKFFFSPSIGLDVTSGPADTSTFNGSPGDDDRRAGVQSDAFRTDLLAHLDIGPQFDISRNVGVYLAGGLTFQMLRYLGATADIALGVQLRAP
jgi:hypothetical protein